MAVIREKNPKQCKSDKKFSRFSIGGSHGKQLI
jgi:hypothetical protein